MKARIKQLHFGLLLFLFANLLLQLFFNLGIEAHMVFGLKIIAFGTGIILFFLYWKQRTCLKYYAGLYAFSPLAVFGGYLLDGIFGAILGSIFLLPFNPTETVIRNGPYEIRTRYAGFMGACCPYSIHEHKYLLFEKWRADFRAPGPSSEFARFEVNNQDQAIIHFKPQAEMPDTILVNLN